MREDRVETEHESYGLLSISRTSGGDGSLFGASVKHFHTIRLSVSRAVHARDLSNDWYHARRELIEVEMSPAQFAEAITSLNHGQGVPCTIRHVDGEMMSKPPYSHVRQLFQKEFRDRAATVARGLDEAIKAAEELSEQPTASKADRRAILAKLRMARQEIASNMPFVADQFDEQMEKSETEAKAAIDAFVTHAVVTAGLTAIRNGTPIVEMRSIETDPTP